MLHTKGTTTVVVYDIYLEVYEGKIDHSWKNTDPVNYCTFREQLST